MWPRDVHLPKMNEAKRSQRETSRSQGQGRLSNPLRWRLQGGWVLSSRGQPKAPSQNPGCQRCTQDAGSEQRRAGSSWWAAGPCGDPCPQPLWVCSSPATSGWPLRNPAVSSLSLPPLIIRQVAQEVAGPGRKLPGHCPQLFAVGTEHWERAASGGLDAQSPRKAVGGFHPALQDAARGAPPVQLPPRKEGTLQ